MATSAAPRNSGTTSRHHYVPRGRNQLHTIFERHFDKFCRVYDERYAATYGMFRLDRIRDIGERFLTCGDYRHGVARIRCTNPDCGHDYFRPFSCKGFYLCPSCSQKRTLLFAEHLTNEVLLDVTHRQFVFTMPKALRPFFRHDRRLLAEVSRLIYTMITEFYTASAAVVGSLRLQHRRLSPADRRQNSGKPCPEHLSPSSLAEEDPIRAV